MRKSPVTPGGDQSFRMTRSSATSVGASERGSGSISKYAGILQLQATAGNRAIQRMVDRPIQRHCFGGHDGEWDGTLGHKTRNWIDWAKSGGINGKSTNELNPALIEAAEGAEKRAGQGTIAFGATSENDEGPFPEAKSNGLHAEVQLIADEGSNFTQIAATRTTCAACAKYMDGFGIHYPKTDGEVTANWKHPEWGAFQSSDRDSPLKLDNPKKTAEQNSARKARAERRRNANK